MLREINPRRRRYSDDQVNFVRESYHLEGKSIDWIRGRVAPACSRAGIWRMAVGRTYRHVPLSERLLVAYQEKRERRERAAAQAAEILRRPRVASAAAEEPPAAEVDELIEDETDPIDEEVLGGGSEDDEEDWV